MPRRTSGIGAARLTGAAWIQVSRATVEVKAASSSAIASPALNNAHPIDLAMKQSALSRHGLQGFA
jgi:hypothetical protein